MKFVDLTGQRFGRLVVIERLPNNKHGGAMWLCECDCGSGKPVATSSNHLRMGDCKSCGCLYTEHTKKIAARTTHGKSYTNTYRRYHNIKSRCHNPSVPSFKDYGARGIALHPEWRDNFDAFYEYVSRLPHFGEPGYTLERINNDNGYEPDNVRWATRAEQNCNTRRNQLVTYDGKTQTIKQWADEYGIKYSKLRERIQKLHWTIEKALNTP